MQSFHLFAITGVVLAACGSTPTSTVDAPPGATSLTGKLGTLGAIKPTASSWVISNSGETLIYMSSSALTCDQVRVSRWLGSQTAGAQVVEVVVRGVPVLGATAVPPAEINYGEGGKSSAGETSAASGTITFTKTGAASLVEGSVTGTFDNGDTINGIFHAEFCSGGQGF
jgi:hypothetical protein